MDLTEEELVDVGVDAMTAGGATAPSAARDRVLAAAGSGRRRAVLHPDWEPATGNGVTSLAAFMKTAAELAELLGPLSPGDLSLPTRAHGSSVGDLVAHLVGVERYLLGQFGRGPVFHAPHREDHHPATRAAAADVLGAGPSQLARAWWLEVMRLIGVCGEVGPDVQLSYHHLAGSVRGLMVVRTFELWTHDEDIRAALGQPANELDAARLSLMSRKLVELLPVGMALEGTTRPGRSATVRLTGAGRPVSYDIALEPGATPGPPDITITAGTLALCRLAANRLAVDDLEVDVEGDRSLLEPVLVGATAFSMD